MTADDPIARWPDHIERTLADRCRLFKSMTVLRETDSTQDAARRLAAKPGHIIAAARQTSGRGRLGRAWSDTLDHGIAVTFVVERNQPEFLAIAAAIAAALAIERIAGIPTHIKWPNDVLINNRKVAGVLIEQFDQTALIGVGVNISQTQWSDELNNRAISLVQAGKTVDRLDALSELIAFMDAWLGATAEELNREFAARDVLTGGTATFRSAGRDVQGQVLRVDPMRGIELRAADGTTIHLPAATTSVLHFQPSGQTAFEPTICQRLPGTAVSSQPMDR